MVYGRYKLKLNLVYLCGKCTKRLEVGQKQKVNKSLIFLSLDIRFIIDFKEFHAKYSWFNYTEIFLKITNASSQRRWPNCDMLIRMY